MIKANCFQQNV